MEEIFGRDAQELYDLGQLIREHAMMVDRAFQELATVKDRMRKRLDTVIKKWQDGGIDPSSEYPEHIDPDMLSYLVLEDDAPANLPEQQECELQTECKQ